MNKYAKHNFSHSTNIVFLGIYSYFRVRRQTIYNKAPKNSEF